MSLGDYMDGPEAFDVHSFQDIQQESERACDQTVKILGAVHQQLFTAVLQHFKLPGQDNSERTPSRTEAPRPISEVSPTQPTSSAIFPPYTSDGPSVGGSAIGTVPDSLDSRIATHTQRGAGTTSDPLQRSAFDDRGLLPSQRGPPMARPDSQISPMDSSSPFAFSPTIAAATRPVSEVSPIQYVSPNAFARPPPALPTQSPWDDPPAPSAPKSIRSPIITDEQQDAQHSAPLQQVALDSQMDSNSQLQTSADPHSQITSSNTSMSDTPNSFAARAAADEMRGTRISHPSHYEINIPTGTSYGSYKGETQAMNPEPERTKNADDESSPKLIDRESVVRQMTSNENFLEKRRRSKKSFRHDMDNLRQSSTNLASSISSSASHSTSPVPLTTPEFSSSPSQVSRPNSTLLMTRSCSREGPNPVLSKSPSPRSSAALSERPASIAELTESEQSQTRNSSAMIERPISIPEHPDSERPNSIASEPMIFGPLESPPLTLSSGRQSAAEDWGFLAKTLKVPGFGESVGEGLEVVGQLVSDPGLMLANEDQVNKQPTPALSIQSVDYPLRHDSSFFLYGGFCESAKMLARGDESALKVIKKPGVRMRPFPPELSPILTITGCWRSTHF
jgi:hypothetical protein